MELNTAHETILTEDQIAKPNPKAESQIQNKYQDSEEEKEKLEKLPPHPRTNTAKREKKMEA